MGQHCCSCCPVPQPGVPAGLPRGHELSLGLTLCRLALPLCEALLELPQPRGPHLQSQSCRGCEGPPGLPQSHPQPVPHSSCTQSIPVGLGLSGKETPQPLSSVPGLCPPHSTAQHSTAVVPHGRTELPGLQAVPAAPVLALGTTKQSPAHPLPCRSAPALLRSPQLAAVRAHGWGQARQLSICLLFLFFFLFDGFTTLLHFYIGD